ncbi:MAG: hypothetical protein JO148_07000 [Acidimicrobiia bacterium]|nr:hypothetical protein [Acidimicrobiia bacterium]
MYLLAAANPWIYWVAFLLIAGAALMIIALAVGYVIKVVAAKYPRQQ